MSHNPVKRNSFFYKITRLDEILAAVCLVSMILIVLTQIILRNFFQTGIGGADPLVRHLVLWVAFLGAGIASKDSSHIKIDFLSKYLSRRVNKILEFIVSVFSAFILGILIYAAISFVRIEFTSELKIPLLNIPVWIGEIIIPAGYIIIAVHTLINGVKSLSGMTKED